MNIESVRSIVAITVAKAIRILQDESIVDSKFTVNIKLRNGFRQNRSWGGIRNGEPFISLAINNYLSMRDDAAYSFHEYAAFKDDLYIGTYTGTAKQTLMTLVVHEVAHAAQYYKWSKNMIAYRGDKSIRGHGLVWKVIYKTLRIKMDLVNNPDTKPVSTVIVTPKSAPKSAKKTRTPRSNSLLSQAKQLYSESNNKSRDYIVSQFIDTLDMKPSSAMTYYYTVLKSVG
jgi:hypothetical protein